ncbi:leucine-rich repeat protein [Candidatus Enterococcus courvalinii]|uniref:Leucine-rich repeat protein n=1 Tax=Candidatus Enterococcus courvalinii TaxID=2815329 RepID=A0ABS3HY59_9ENTE|nr:leucine-rich repeat protein [Enterococcus sp. MSG2901]MBO0481394.1 leucine-rich repeat protein [Enterococcus sp. MSG2901]
MQQKIWRKVSVLCMVLALMMPSIVQATEIVTTSETEVSTEKMAEETSKDVQVSNEKLSIEEGNQQIEPVVEENEPVVLEEENPTIVEEPTNKEENSDVPEKMGDAESLDETLEEELSDSDTVVGVTAVIENGIEFELNQTDDTAKVTAYHGAGGQVDIPATVFWKNWDYDVTEIGPSAFQSTNISDVFLPSSLRIIADNAFYNNFITELVIPDNVITIGARAFGMNNITRVTIPPSFNSGGGEIFDYNPLKYMETEVNNVEVLAGVGILALIGGSATERTILRVVDYKSETERELVLTKGEEVNYEISQQYRVSANLPLNWEEYTPTVQWFKNDTSLSGETNPLLQLESVTPGDSGVYHAVVDGERFPDLTLEVIDESIEQAEFDFEFSGTEDESTATLIRYNGEGGDVIIPSEVLNNEEGWDKPSPVTEIKNEVFYNKNLASVDIPNSIETIGEQAFAGNKLSSVIIPNSVTHMGIEAFQNNDLTSLTLSNSLQTLEERVFSGNNLTNIFIPSNILLMQSEIFEDNPLHYVETSAGNVNSLRIRLTQLAMTGVTERTILRALDYEVGTENEKSVFVGETVGFAIAPQYQLRSTESRVWDSYTPDVQWEKDETTIEGASSTILELVNVQESDSGVYRAIVDGMIFPDLQLQVKPEMEPEIPSIDPSEPPVFPEEVNPDIEGLSIRYASDMHFNSAPFSLLDQTLLLANQDQRPMVTVQDMRPIAERSGWELLVSQDALFMNGAEIVINPYVHQANQDNLLIEASSELVLNDAPQRFAGTTNTEQPNPAGIVSMGMESEKNPMSLRVPGKTGVNSYETTVHWQLVTGP